MTGPGLFLVLEGVEGCGKSTQAALLDRWLTAAGISHTVAREPGGTPVGESIRQVLLHRVDLQMPPETEMLLYVAARAAFVRDIVRPALARGDVLVADRYELSTFAYQGYGRGLDLDRVRGVNDVATGGLLPDLYLVLDVPVSEGRGRQAAEGKPDDRIEGAGNHFLERVRDGYLEMARNDPRAVVLDGSGDPDLVHERIVAQLRSRFPETFALP